MKIRRFTLAMALLLVAGVPPQAVAQSGHDLLQKALVMERAEGNLDGAVVLYNRILAEHQDERTLCAQALMQMGSFYERLGRPEATEAFQRVVEEYPDQAEKAREARVRLEAIRGSAGPERQVFTNRDPTYTLLLEDHERFGQGRGQVSLSPDGRRLVLWIRDLGIYILDPVTALPRHILAFRDPAERLRMARWSPDGTRIAVLHVTQTPEGVATGESILIIDPEGNEISRIPLRTGGNEIPGLSPGDERGGLLYSLVWAPDQQGFTYARQGAIYSVTLDGRETRLAGEEGAGHVPMLGGYSPDGGWLAYSTGFFYADRPGFDVWVMPAAGGPAHRLTQHPGMDLVPSWGTDGFLYFLSDRSGSRNIWRMRFDPQRGERIGNLEQVTFFKDAQVGMPSPAREAGNMAFVLWRARETVRVADAEHPGASTLLARGTAIGLSPEDSRVLYKFELNNEAVARARTDGIFSVSGLGGAPIRLSPESHYGITAARFSPDGSMVEYIANAGDGPAEFQVPATGGEPRRVRSIVQASEDEPTTGRWSPDRSFRVFVRGSGLYRVPCEGGEPTLLAKLTVWDGSSIGFSPDGRYVSAVGFDRTRSGPGEFQLSDIYIVALDGGEVRRLTTDAERTRGPSWHPDGERLTYLALDADNHGTTRMAYLDGRPTTLFHDEPNIRDGTGHWAPDGMTYFFMGFDEAGSENTYRRNPDGTVDLMWENGSLPFVSADGRTYLFTVWEISSELWMMEDFR